MKRFFVLIVSVALLTGISGVSDIAGAFQSDFNRDKLSPKGRSAYRKLASACIFAVGGVGFANETSKEELAWYDLLDEPQAIDALKNLVQTGSYEGALYGLLGLSIKDREEFDRAVEVYKARKERPEWQTTGSFECFRPDGDTVTTASGCIINNEPRDKVVYTIKSGYYDRFLRRTYRSLR